MSRAKAIRAKIEAAECKIEIDIRPAAWRIVLDAPPGKWFRTSCCPVECSVWAYGQMEWDLAEREIDHILAQGFTGALDA